MRLLSRVADSLYWISRYLERAEHTVRIVEVGIDLGLGRGAMPDESAVGRFCESLGLAPHADTAGHAPVVDAALFDARNANSAIACVTAARENARQVREEISSEMWQQINALYLRVKQMREETDVRHVPAASRAVIEGVHLFQGITDATMNHGEGWQYLQAGRFLERARATAVLLQLFLSGSEEHGGAPPMDQADWVALLRSCAALEGYCRYYTADIRAERVAEFLLLNAEFPRSIRFAASRVEIALRSLARSSGRPPGARAERLAGRLRASLDYGQVDEILADGAGPYLAGIERQCAQIHASLYQAFITYPVEAEIPA